MTAEGGKARQEGDFSYGGKFQGTCLSMDSQSGGDLAELTKISLRPGLRKTLLEGRQRFMWGLADKNGRKDSRKPNIPFQIIAKTRRGLNGEKLGLPDVMGTCVGVEG